MAAGVGVPMCQAMMEHDRGNHDRAFELLYPLRYKMAGIGGSDAQVRSSVPADGSLAVGQPSLPSGFYFSVRQLSFSRETSSAS